MKLRRSPSMADHDGGAWLHSLLPPTSAEEPLSFQCLARLRALIINPSTPHSTLSSVSETLTRSIRLTPDERAINLLSELSARLRGPVLAESLDAEAFASLCFGSSASVRVRLLRSAAERLDLTPYLKLTLFLGFSKDPRPCVRRVSLDGLVSVSGESAAMADEEMIRGCYLRAVELLSDGDDGVRSSAIRAVCAWGVVLGSSSPKMKAQCYDEVFVKCCSMARDMSMKVRVETYISLGKIEMVSEDILLQSLSKKVLPIVKEKRSLGLCCGEQFEVVVSNVAGALLHGLEDEFHEVRKSACCALSKLTLISGKFAIEALELLMDMLNDDSVIVRLQALDTIHTMAACDRLKLQVKHMQMFLGPLSDKNTSIRDSARKILKLVKLSVLELFKSTVDALLQSLSRYPEDEVDIFSVLFHIGRNHRKFVIVRIEDIHQQIEQTFEYGLDFDNPRVAGLIVLAVSAPVLSENSCTIPPSIYSYAVTILGRISNALSDIIDRSSLLAYLCQCSRATRISALELNKYSNSDGISEAQFGLSKFSNLVINYNIKVHEEVIESMNAILAKATDTWPMFQSGNIRKVLMILRSCKEEVSRFNSKCIESDGIVVFTFKYIQTLKLLLKVCGHFRLSNSFTLEQMGNLELLFGKLEKRLTELRATFIGLSKYEELHILELLILTYTLRLSKFETCCKIFNQRRLASTISQIEYLVNKGAIELSEFVTEVKNSLHEIPLSRLFKLFSLRQFVFHGGLIKHIKAELNVCKGDFEDPINFIPGLPVGISCLVSLWNVEIESRVWLRMTIDDSDLSAQFIFLDLARFEDSGGDGIRKFTVVAPFYDPPKASALCVSLCIGMECQFEDLRLEKGCCYGPKHELAYLCEERKVFLVLRCKE